MPLFPCFNTKTMAVSDAMSYQTRQQRHKGYGALRVQNKGSDHTHMVSVPCTGREARPIQSQGGWEPPLQLE